MILINREINSKEITTEKGKNFNNCQASLNSDGNITLRNFDSRNKNSDEIIVLSKEETRAIVKLFSEIGEMNKRSLPF